MNLSTFPCKADDFHYWTEVSIRYSDQDPMQHVNNVAITAFLEAGRAALIREVLGSFGTPEAGMVLANVTINFLHEVTYPGTVKVGGRLSSVGSRSFSSHYAIFQANTCCVVSKSTNVFFDTKNRVSREPSSEIINHLKSLLK